MRPIAFWAPVGRASKPGISGSHAYPRYQPLGWRRASRLDSDQIAALLDSIDPLPAAATAVNAACSEHLTDRTTVIGMRIAEDGATVTISDIEPPPPDAVPSASPLGPALGDLLVVEVHKEATH